MIFCSLYPPKRLSRIAEMLRKHFTWPGDDSKPKNAGLDLPLPKNQKYLSNKKVSVGVSKGYPNLLMKSNRFEVIEPLVISTKFQLTLAVLGYSPAHITALTRLSLLEFLLESRWRGSLLLVNWLTCKCLQRSDFILISILNTVVQLIYNQSENHRY